MRIRNNKVNVFLSNDEKFILKRDSSKLNLSQSEYIRNLIVGYEIKIPEEVLELVEKRKKARQEKNWTESDRLRDEIQNLGYSVKDTKDGVDILKN